MTKHKDNDVREIIEADTSEGVARCKSSICDLLGDEKMPFLQGVVRQFQQKWRANVRSMQVLKLPENKLLK